MTKNDDCDRTDVIVALWDAEDGTEPRRILADFLIGAHAVVSGYKLLTLDAGIYQTSFPKLKIATA
jgi:predicted nucleic acid-binding protein